MSAYCKIDDLTEVEAKELLKKLDEKRNNAIKMICELCVRLNPQHKHCNSCPEIKELK